MRGKREHFTLGDGHGGESQGERYRFCGGGCRKAFELEPAKNLEPGYTPSMFGAFKDWLRAVLHARRAV